MTDENIVRLYWDRDEQAITESSGKYGAYCNSIATNILFDRSDAEECVNDTWMHAWNAMPPNKPSVLSTFLGKITRNIAFDLYKKLHREKRGGRNIDLVLDELSEIVSGKDDVEKHYEEEELRREINEFLKGESEERRRMFILRYWYADSVIDIAKRFETGENNVSVTLNRMRNKLRSYLAERGYDI